MVLEGAASSKSLANEEGVHNWNYSSKLRLRSEPTKETQTTSTFAILTPEENIHESVANIFQLWGKHFNDKARCHICFAISFGIHQLSSTNQQHNQPTSIIK